MSYLKAVDVFPKEILELIQQYVDGQCVYIPKKENSKKSWGENTNIKEELLNRNSKIYHDYMSGMTNNELSAKYFLSVKSIQRIIKMYQE